MAIEQLIHASQEEDLSEHEEKRYPWFFVVDACRTDFVSSLGYVPSIAAGAVGAIAPIATLLLVLLLLFGITPLFKRVVSYSPFGQGSIKMIASLLNGWPSKIAILILLGFGFTDFIITITLSDADAAQHIVANPLLHHYLSLSQYELTYILIGFLVLLFIIGFREAMSVAVVIVNFYIVMNVIVLSRGIMEIWHKPEVWGNWISSLLPNNFHVDMSNVALLVGAVLLSAILGFPQLALGLSGSETAVALIPHVKGKTVAERIRNTRKLILMANISMAILLTISSFVCTLLIPQAFFRHGGPANGRAIAYLAHLLMGQTWGTLYDLSTVLILAFAGASAISALLALIPRYLPKLGMGPEFLKNEKWLVLVIGIVSFIVTWVFNASVDAQGGAYATGMSTIMASAGVAVTIVIAFTGKKKTAVGFGILTGILLYMTGTIYHDHVEGLKIAACFIIIVVVSSLISRAYRSTEPRVGKVDFDLDAQQILQEAVDSSRKHYGWEDSIPTLSIVTHDPHSGIDDKAYMQRLVEAKQDHNIPEWKQILILEINVKDPSEFVSDVLVTGHRVGNHLVLRADGYVVPNTIVSIARSIKTTYGAIVHLNFTWTEGNPIGHALKFVFFGEGDTARVCKHILDHLRHVDDKKNGNGKHKYHHHHTNWARPRIVIHVGGE